MIIKILNSLSSNLSSFHNLESTNVSFAVFDNKTIKFFYCDKSEVKAAVVTDVERPFCPLPRNKLFLNILNQREEVEKIIEKISSVISNTVQPKLLVPGSVSGAAVAAGMEALKGNGGRVLLFSANANLVGFGASRPREDKIITNVEKEKSIYFPQNNIFKELAEKYSTERIVVDLFVIASSQLDLATLSQISTQTGGKTYFYSINNKILNDFRYKLEKLHYDLTRIISRPNYYDVKFMIRKTVPLDIIEIIGQFGRVKGEAFKMNGVDPDFSFSVFIKYLEKLKAESGYSFQIACLYLDNFNQTYLRVINYNLTCDNDIGRMYFNVDVDTMTKVMAVKELSLMTTGTVEKILARENFTQKIINFLLFYRKKCSEKSPVQQLILPASVKFIPLFLTSLLKKPFLRKNKDGVLINSAVSLLLNFLREPTYSTIKSLHPKFYRFDDILEDQSLKVDDPELVLVSNFL